MFSKPRSEIMRGAGFRLSLWYSTVFIISILLLFSLSYILLSRSIRDSNRKISLTKLEEYTRTLKGKGLNALLDQLREEHSVNQQTGFFVRISDHRNLTLSLTLPSGWSDVDMKQIEQRRFAQGGKWVSYRFEQGGHVLEITSFKPEKGVRIQVGYGVEERKTLLKHFRTIFAFIVLPGIFLAVGGGFLISHRAMRPVRSLIKAVKTVQDGKMDARVPSNNSGDELDELVNLFNGMLARIEALITGMRSALDAVAHDLRTPLTRMRSGVEISLKEDRDNEALRETLMDVAEESERIAAMLNTIMDISEAESDLMRLDIVEIDLESLLEEIVDIYQYAAEDKNVKLKIESFGPAFINGDKNRLLQALANVVDNAVKYTPEGGEATLTLENGDQEAILKVSDTGRGISPEDLPHIFDRLYRGDRSRSERGLGLGLSLVQAIIKAHGGEIEVDSTINKGSIFSIRLPKKQKAAAAN